MLSYRHGFHAGNFADVLKHLVLIDSLHYLAKKDKPFCYFDTHAGAGDYALDDAFAQKNREFNKGIGRLWSRSDLPDAVLAYVNNVKAFNANAKLNRYPGSPLIAQHLLRQNDRLCLFELHPTEIKSLNQTTFKDKRVRRFHADGLTASLPLLPPPERRALVLVDPAYELKNDYRLVVDALVKMHQRFATGTFLLWYPVVERRRIDELERALKKCGIRNIQLFELGIAADQPEQGMTACGMIAINAPWTLAAQMRQTLPWLVGALAEQGNGFCRLETLVDE